MIVLKSVKLIVTSSISQMVNISLHSLFYLARFGSNMGHIPEEAPLDSRPQIWLFNLQYAAHGPANQFRDLYKASFSCLTIQDNYYKVELATFAFKANCEARTCLWCDSGLYTRICTHWILIP